MRIIQLLTTVSYGDAVSNDVLALHETLIKNGYRAEIYAENVDKRIHQNLVKKIAQIPAVTGEDVILYHLSTGTDLNFKLPRYKCRKIIIYHNITPYKYFEGYSSDAYNLCKKGYEGLKYLADKVDYCIADSEYNKEDLLKAGYKCKIDVLPILIPFSDYEKKPNQAVLNRYDNEEYTNILFTGRIAPNKKQESVIGTFYYYQKYYNSKSRLFLVGNYAGMERYYYRLKEYIDKLNLKNVYLTGHIKFDEILAYYRSADVFLSMSEHEGFCVPLVEAMKFDVPVIAYDKSAIGYTLGGAGILLKNNSPLEAAGMIDRVINDRSLKDKVVSGQRERLEDFSHEKIEKQFLSYLRGYIDG